MTFLIWQLVDSGFPSGGFAHSGGLEAAMHHGEVDAAHAVEAFARQTIVQAAHAALPIVRAAHADRDAVPALDRLSNAFLTNPVANRASRTQGRALLTSTTRSFPSGDLDRLDGRIRGEKLAGHYAPVFGAVLHALGVEEMHTSRLFLFLAARSVASAAVRLGLIGAFESQQVQHAVNPEIDRAIAACAAMGPDDITQTAPLIDLRQSTHDRLYTRLFQS